MKKYLISSISLAMILSTTLSINADSKIKDIEGHWANKEISNFIENSYVKGYKDNTFKPNKQITRAEFVKIVNNYFGFNQEGISKFKDINPNEWYYNDICIAIKAGYINGYEDNTFKPNKEITREEATKIIISIKNQIDNNYDKLETFQDKHLVSNWAKPYIEGAIESGYLKGDNLKRINPKKNITRAESVSILARTDKKIAKKIINKIIKPNTIENKENQKIDLNPKNQEDNKLPEIQNPIIPDPSLRKESKKPIIYVEKDEYFIAKDSKWNILHPNLMINASAYDQDGERLDVEYVGTVDSRYPGRYPITLIARDSYGNYTEKKVYVTVENYYNPYGKPTIHIYENYIVLNKGDKFSYDMIHAIARDYGGHDLSDNIQFLGNVDTNKLGLHTINLSVTDKYGNNTCETVFINVK